MAETEKITINLSVVDLGKIDLLVEQGFYSTRTDMIRAGIRTQLNLHNRELDEAIQRRAMIVGVLVYTKEGLEKKLAKNEMVKITCVGMLVLEKGITGRSEKALHKRAAIDLS